MYCENMTWLAESRVLQDLTNRAEAPKEAWPELPAEATPYKPAAAAAAAASEPRCCSHQAAALTAAVPELELVVKCATELHQLWTQFASGGSSSTPYLLDRFAALEMLLQPPSAAPPGLSEEVLRLAEAPPPSSPRGRVSLASGGCSSAEPGGWSEVMRGVAGQGSAWRPTPVTAQAPERQQCRAFPQKQLLQQDPDDPDRLERRLSFEAAADCSDSSHSSSASRAAAEEQSPSCGSLDDEEFLPPSWRQKELCEKEIENRLAELLEQEHYDDDAEEEDDDDGLQFWDESGDSAAASCDGGSSCGGGAICQPQAELGGAVSSTETGPIPEDRWNFKTPPPRRQSSRRPQPPAGAGTAAAPTTQQLPAAASSQPAPAVADSWQQQGSGGGVEKTGEVDEVLVDVTKCLLRWFHRESERQRPDLDLLKAKVVPAERVQAVDWLLQSCWTLGFPEVVPFAAALYLDRYCLMLPGQLHSDHMQVLYLAFVSVALKMHGTSTQVPAPFRQVLSHMGQHKIPVETILEQERRVLAALDFEVSTPTSSELLDLLAAPCDVAPWEEGACGCCRACTYPLIWQLAGFLLRLALREMDILYRYPSSVLATSAAYLAFWSSQAEGCRPCAAKQGVLLRRLSLACAQPVTNDRPRQQVHLSTPSSAGSGSSVGERRYHRI